MDTIRNYRNKILLDFEKRGDSFSLDVPHIGKWNAIIRYLIRRGFKVSANPFYVEQFNVLSKYHKIGYKKQVACLLEIKAARIEVQFGHIKNLWKCGQSFWDNPSDSRYTELSYLESAAVKLEIKKLMAFCSKWELKFIKENYDMLPAEYIINDLNRNKHIHGEVNCLDDIRMSIKEDSYDYLCNSDDRDKTKIICGQRKYFYDPYTSRLSCGIAWHNINNMWWVIVNKKKYNLACFELFDIKASLPRRKPITQAELKNKFDRLLKKYEGLKDYHKCIIIQKSQNVLFGQTG